MKTIFFSILLFNMTCFAGPAWQIAKAKPTATVKIVEWKALTKGEGQISCDHLKFRYKELEKIVNDLGWLFSKDTVENKGDAYEYISNRLQADPRPIAGESSFQVKAYLSEDLLNQTNSPIEAIGILGATNFDLFFPKEDQALLNSIEIKDKDFSIVSKVNAYDICAKKYLEVFLLRGCPKNETEAFNCGNSSCPASLTYDWQACTSAEVIRINLKPLQNKLGLRKREIRWKLK